MEKYKINFSKNQRLPDGYSVEWWECDEHFHFTIPNDNFESLAFSSKWMARRA
jgi:hypothetical protein